MNQPSLNATNDVWRKWFNSLDCEGLLAAWCWLAEHGHQRQKEVAIMVAGSRYFTLAMRARILEKQIAELP